MKNNIKLYLGDCKEVLKGIEDNSVDLISTDPPYGYSFMGKDWDKVVIPTSTWKECLRVLKPGAFAFIMSAPRQDVLSKMICNLSEAGFRTDFTSIYWTYASGFPKASNIGKMVDKKACKEKLTQKLGRKPTKKEFEKELEGYREIIGKGKSGNPETHKSSYQMANQGDKNNFGGEFEITKGNSPLEGSYGGFQPKPAVEIIIVAMKPLSEKTYVDQAMKNGKGVTWLDNCRVPCNDKEGGSGHINFAQQHADRNDNHKDRSLNREKQKTEGCFPANLLVSDDVLNDGKISKDECSYSRYFDLDKWWEERIKQLPPEVQKVFPYLICPKASKREKNKGCENLESKSVQPAGLVGAINKGIEKPREKRTNSHPTVKPIKLMFYLITLGSRENDVVLDPFMGSGTTGISAKLLNRKFIGIEMSEEYIKIASARIKAWNK